MRKVGGEPAVDAVAVEDDLVRSRSLRSLRHDWNGGLILKIGNSIFNFLHCIYYG
jgi:hypothetical protein